jgi:hypothetical protein
VSKEVIWIGGQAAAVKLKQLEDVLWRKLLPLQRIDIAAFQCSIDARLMACAPWIRAIFSCSWINPDAALAK